MATHVRRVHLGDRTGPVRARGLQYSTCFRGDARVSFLAESFPCHDHLGSMTTTLSHPLVIQPSSLRRRLAWMVVVAVCYVLAGRLGLAAALVDTNITLAWPPTGIAIAALLRGGIGLWPGVAVGAFVLSCWMGAPLPVALGIAVGNTLGPVVTALLLRRLGLHHAFDRRRDAGWFCLAVIAGLAIPPTVGVACLAWSGLVEWGAAAWLLWWLGDVVGAVVVAPLLLTVKRDAGKKGASRKPAGKKAEAAKKAPAKKAPAKKAAAKKALKPRG